MPNTPITASPYPAGTALPDVPTDLMNALTTLERFTVPRFPSAAARDTAIPAPVAGQLAFTTGLGFQQNDGSGVGGWAPLVPALPSRIPFATAAGRVGIQFNSQVGANATVNFPAGRFTVAPRIMATLNLDGNGVGPWYIWIQASNITASSFLMNAEVRSAVTGLLTVAWTAVQMTPTSADG